MSEINVHLFGKPEWEIDLEQASAEDFKALGEELKERLARISEIVTILEKNGWSRSAGLYDIMFYKNIKLDTAKIEIGKLGIKEDEINLDEFDEEEIDEDEESDDLEEDSQKYIESKWVKKK